MEEHINTIASLVLRILLASIFGGIVGYEREYTHRPAGLRTHLLVCVGSALTMMTGEFVWREFGYAADPMRIGAQVVSGIGFLGAGTIIKAGFNVRGLTTAASLWAVSCLGLACGIGYYTGAIVGGISICVVLISLKKFDSYIIERNAPKTILLRATDIRVALQALSHVLTDLGIEIRDIRFSSGHAGDPSTVRVTIRMPNCSTPELAARIAHLPGSDGAEIEGAGRQEHLW